MLRDNRRNPVSQRSLKRAQRSRQRRRLLFEGLENRELLASFAEVDSLLNLNLNVANTAVGVIAQSTSYTLTLTGDTWSGVDSPSVTGNGTTSLTVTPVGLGVFDTVNISDSATGSAVKFNDSGANAYSDDFIVTLDDDSTVVAGEQSVVFNGTSNFGANGLDVFTTRNIVLNSGANLATSSGDITFQANTAASTSAGQFAGITLNNNATITASDTGAIQLTGRGGTANDFNYGVVLNAGSRVTGGSVGTAVNIHGTGGSSNSNFGSIGIAVLGSSTTLVTSLGGAVSLTGQGGGSSGGQTHAGVMISGGQITAGDIGTVTVMGTGGNSGAGGSGSNYGVQVGNSGTKITSGGGAVQVTGQGGVGDSGSNYGVYVQSGQITSGGTGTVNVIGTAGNGAVNGSRGVFVVSSGQITSGGSGSVTITGTGGTGSASANVGVSVHDNGSAISSGSGAVSVTGQGGGSGTGGQNNGVLVTLGAQITAGGNGTVTLQGTAANNNGSNNAGVRIDGTGSTVTSNGGGVSVIGQGGASISGTGFGNSGVVISNNGRITAGSIGAVSVNGTGAVNGSGGTSYGVYVNANPGTSAITSSGGDVQVIGQGGGSGFSNHGVFVDFNGQITAGGTGSVAVVGTGGSTGSSVGVKVSGNTYSSAIIASSGGSVQVTGQGGSAIVGGATHGVDVGTNGRINAGGAGTVTVEGTGGTGSSGNNQGVLVNGTSSTIGSNGGAVEVTGTAGAGSSTSSYAVRVLSSGTISTALNGGAITLVGDSMDIDGTAVINAGTHTAALKPRTATGTLGINFGGADVTGSTLGLTDAELDRITAGTLSIGDNNSGAITVSSAITRPAPAAVNLSTGGNIVYNPGSFNTAGGTLNLSPGSTGSVQPITSGADATTTSSVTSFAPGSDLKINIAGTTVDSQYNQFNVVGTVNLNGVDLTLTGGFTSGLGNVFTIVSTTSGVSGAFTGLAENATTVFNDRSLRVNYTPTAVTLTDVGSATIPVNLSVSSHAGTETGTTLILVTATADSAVSGDQSLILGVSGAGIDANDYRLSDIITILNGTTQGSVTFTVKDDLLNEGNETATLAISNPSSGLLLGTTTTQDITITDDDNVGTSYYGLPEAGAYRVVRNVDTIEIFTSGNSLVVSRPLGMDPVVISGTVGDDTLTIDFGGGDFPVPITFHGGTQSSTPGDSLTLTGGTFATGTFTFSNDHDGTVELTGNSQISYTGLEPIVTTNTTINDLILTFNGGAETITLTDAIGSNMTIDSSLGESVTFANPTGSLTINAGHGDDTITITSVDAVYSAALTINGDAGNDTVNLSADITFASGENLDVDLTDDAAISDVDSIQVGAGANLVLSGTGAATLAVSRNLALASGSSIVATNGNVTLTANQQAEPTSGNFVGIDIDGGTVETTGLGAVIVTGRGGDDAAGSQYGVHLHNGGQVIGGDSSSTAIVYGWGGAAGEGSNHGVVVSDADSQITSHGGNVNVYGDGGSSFYYNSNSHGVLIRDGGVITSAGTSAAATVTVGGRGAYVGTMNHGVVVNGADSQITSSGGAVRVDGTGGDYTDGSVGVNVTSGGVITSAGTGAEATVTVSGIGGGTSSYGNTAHGVVVNGAGSQITSRGGAVLVSGSNNDWFGGPLVDSHGVLVQAGGVITSESTEGTVTVVGYAYGQYSHGVFVTDTDSRISSSGGDIEVSGSRNGGSGSVGIALRSGGRIVATTGAPAVTLIADSMDLNSGISVDAGVNHVYLRPSGSEVNLGAADDTSFLGLAYWELTSIIAGTVHVVAENSGTIVVSEPIYAGYHLSLTTGGFIDIRQSVYMDPNKDFSATSTDFNFSGNGGWPYLNAMISVTGTGEINVTATRSISIYSGASITTDNGSITLDANQQETSTSDGFVGVYIQGGTIEATGSGTITVRGKSGFNQTGGIGVWLCNGGQIIGGNTGDGVTVTGTVGASAGSNGFGVWVGANFNGTAASQITSRGGAVWVTGTGSSSAEGVRLDDFGAITSGSNADIIITADSLNITGSTLGAINSGSGTTTIRTRTTGTLIDLGGSDIFAVGPPTLGLTDAELDRVTAGTLVVGDANSGTITVSADITHGNNLTLTTGAGVTGTGAISNSSGVPLALAIEQAGDSTYAGLLGGATGGTAADKDLAFTKTGSGTLTLSGANTYSGVTTVSAGVLEVTNASALGSTDSGTAVANGATLQIAPASYASFVEPLTLGGTGHNSLGALRTLKSASWNGPVILESPATIFQADQSFSLDGPVANGGFDLTYNQNATSSHSGSIYGIISGSGGLIKEGPWQLNLGGANTYSGVTTVKGGMLGVSYNGRLGDLTNGTVVQGGASLFVFPTNYSFSETLFISGTGAPQYSGGALNGSNNTVIASSITLTGDARIAVYNSNSTMTISGPIDDGGNGYGLTLQGFSEAGRTLVLSGANTYTGATNVDSGRLRIDGSLSANTAVTVASGAILSGTGTVGGTVDVASSGTVAPGTSTGVLQSGNATLVSGANFDVELHGIAVGTQFDQLDVTGTVDLGSATLNVTLGFTPAAGDAFTIINNDDSDPVNGAFAGLSEGSAFSITTGIHSATFHITYQGGDGNDVIIVVNRPPTDIALSNDSIAENVAPGSLVGTFSTADPDAGETFAYSLAAGSGDTDNSSFTITGDQLTINNSPDFANQSSYGIRVRTTDASGLWFEELFTIAVIGDFFDVIGTDGDDTFVARYTGVDTNTWNITRNAATVFNGTLNSPSTRLRFLGGLGQDSVEVRGSTNADNFALANGKISLSGFTVIGQEIEQWRANGDVGNDLFAVLGGFAGDIVGGSGIDRITGDTRNNVWSIQGSNSGSLNGQIIYQTVESLVGGALDDLFQFMPAGSISGSLQGGGGTDELDYSARTAAVTINLQSGAATGTGGILEIESMRGSGTGADRIIGPNTANTWNISGADAGFLNVDQLLFSGFGSLTGGTGADMFVIEAVGSLSGALNGGSGTDRLELQDRAASLDVSVSTTGRNVSGVVGTFTSVEQVAALGSNVDQLIGGTANTSWLANALGQVVVGSVTYTGFEAIVADSGVDTLTGPAVATQWTVSGGNSGQASFDLYNIDFSGVENLTGGATADLFVIEAVGSLSGTLNGGSGTDRLELQDRAASLDVSVSTTGRNVSGVVGSFTSVEQVAALGSNVDQLIGGTANTSWLANSLGQVVAGSVTYTGFEAIVADSGVDTLTGPAIATQWTVSGGNSGQASFDLYNIDFSGVENLTGGAAADLFVIEAVGSLSGTLNGGSGTDRLELRDRATSLDVSVSTTGRNVSGVVGSFTSVEQVEAAGSNVDRLLGGTANTSWLVNSLGQVVVGSVTYAGFEAITASSGVDTLTGPAVAAQWTVRGANSGEIIFDLFSIGFSGVENLTGGVAVDQFVIAPTGSLSGHLNGGTTASNSVSYSDWRVDVTVNLATLVAANTTAINGTVRNMAVVLGGSGNDTLTGNGSLPTVLVGNAGADVLMGGSGRDILIGGLGADALVSGGGEDILIGGYTAHDGTPDALLALLAEWRNTARTFTTRVDNLRGPATATDPRSNGTHYLNFDTVFADADDDMLTGDTGRDWFWGEIGEISDFLASGSAADLLDVLE